MVPRLLRDWLSDWGLSGKRYFGQPPHIYISYIHIYIMIYYDMYMYMFIYIYIIFLIICIYIYITYIYRINPREYIKPTTWYHNSIHSLSSSDRNSGGFVHATCGTCRIGIQSRAESWLRCWLISEFFPTIDQWIGLRENLNRKPWFLPLNMGVSCKFSLKPIHWIESNGVILVKTTGIMN